jgi:hypothetical protein
MQLVVYGGGYGLGFIHRCFCKMVILLLDTVGIHPRIGDERSPTPGHGARSIPGTLNRASIETDGPAAAGLGTVVELAQAIRVAGPHLLEHAPLHPSFRLGNAKNLWVWLNGLPFRQLRLFPQTGAHRSFL